MSSDHRQLTLFGDEGGEVRLKPDTTDTTDTAPDADAEARTFATSPDNHVVLEASAGTGKTSVLVSRYVRLLAAGVDPANILAMTFTRKAAAEMRERIVWQLRDEAARGTIARARWTNLRDRLADIAISTIDAFCLSLLREFPLEADLDPGFEMADETEVPRLVDESLDRSLRVIGVLAKQDPDVAVVLAQLGVPRTRQALAVLLARRLVAWQALDRFLANGPAGLTAAIVCRRASTALQDALRTVPGGITRLLEDGPRGHPRYALFVREVQRMLDVQEPGDAEVRLLLERVGAHFLTADGRARTRGAIPPYNAGHYPSALAAAHHRQAVFQVAPQVERIVSAFGRDLNVVLARGMRRMFGVALAQYRRSLDERSVLDFSDVLERALALLRQMDEFAQSRYRLESRYHHVLVDEFQDTSRAQWELVSLLIQSWKEGAGVAANPSIFIVGDRKQSIYRFRDAEVTVLQEAARYIEGLRPGAPSPRRSISRSFRALPELLALVNELFTDISQSGARPDDFVYRESDRFAIAEIAPDTWRGPVLGIAPGDEPAICAAAVALEIERVLREETIRDRKTGVPRQARPGDIAILFRSRASHREFEKALERRGVPTYVYKGLGFFDADEIKDASALIRYLADPDSDLRASALLRSGFVRLSDPGLAALGPRLAAALIAGNVPAGFDGLSDEDRRVLAHVRAHVHGWIAQVDRVPPADLLESLIPATAYAYELRGARRLQAWENLKKMRGLVRRIQNRGYATLSRIADHIESLTAGDESSAVLDALDAVNLMTIHAAKGLEFPVVFIVNVAKGAGGPPQPVRVVADGEGGQPSVSVGPFVSDTDDLERYREKQETRRLLYVALTRARDRLYLSGSLKDATRPPGPGSLAQVFPDSLRQLFQDASAALPEIPATTWTSGSGRSFTWRVCRPPALHAEPAVDTPVSAGTVAGHDRFDAIAATGLRQIAVTEWVADPADGAETRVAGPGDITAGLLVHRLFQFAPRLPTPASEDDERALARSLLRPDERYGAADTEELVRTAVRTWRDMRNRPDVIRPLSRGHALHEVPFSLRVEAQGELWLIRGTIDCLVAGSDGSVTVLEFKTGRPRLVHQRQLDVYIRAARALFPGAVVDGVLVYPSA